MIKKINVNGIDYQVGEDSEAKLIATGTFDNEAFEENSNRLFFNLDKTIDVQKNENKLYLVKMYTGAGYIYSIVLNFYLTTFAYVKNLDEDDVVLLECMLNNNWFEAIKATNTGTDLDFGTFVQVYELPFTLGGIE